MAQKKYHLIRTMCSGIVLAVLIFAICMLIRFVNAGGAFTIEKMSPVIIVAGIVFFIFVIIFGRIFCGFLCPLGLFFDVIWKATEMLHLPKLKRNENFMKIMHIINRVFLGFFICGILTLIVILVFFPEMLSGLKIPLFFPISVVAVMIIINSFARRLFCNVCPIGTFIGIFEKSSIVKLKKKSEACVMCGACYEACPMRIKEIYTEINSKNISNPQCIYCGECIKKCQADHALSITVRGRELYSSSEKDFIENQFSDVVVKYSREK